MIDTQILSMSLSIAFALFVIVAIFKTARVVPQRTAVVVERLGKYARTLESGFHILIPFIERVAYTHTMKEEVIDVHPQNCVTKDNIQVSVNGVLYIQVIDAAKASYGINDYRNATVQLAQTTLRSQIGGIDLDKTFEERTAINRAVVEALDAAAGPWGVKVLRYEISDIGLPDNIKGALESHLRAEREKRAAIATSEGKRQALVNDSEGQRQALVNVSEGEKQAMINIAEGKKREQILFAEGEAQEILLLAEATAKGIHNIADVIREEGGAEAVNLKLAEQYIAQMGNLAKENNTMIIPMEMSNVGGALAGLTQMIKQVGSQAKP